MADDDDAVERQGVQDAQHVGSHLGGGVGPGRLVAAPGAPVGRHDEPVMVPQVGCHRLRPEPFVIAKAGNAQDGRIRAAGVFDIEVDPVGGQAGHWLVPFLWGVNVVRPVG